jgi:hypothetical protein
MRSVAACLPLTYAIRDIRAAILSNATLADLLPDLTILAAFALAMPVLGYILFLATERRSRRTGDLGRF